MGPNKALSRDENDVKNSAVTIIVSSEVCLDMTQLRI